MDGYPAFSLIETSRPPASQSLRKALLVLGMSRSGTSLLTHVLHELGAALPRDLMGADHGNPLGHFESKGVVALNDRILQAIDRPWNDPRPLPPRWLRSREAYGFLQQITGQIGTSYGDAPLLVLKDPRLCRLLPLYLDALDMLDIEPLVVLQVRPMEDVVESLADRDDMPPDMAEFLWLRSMAEAEWHSRDCRRVWVSMGEVLADWPGTVRRIADSLRVEWQGAALTEIGSLLKPRLRHHIAGPAAVAGGGRVSAAAWAAVEHGLAGDEPAARAGFDAVRGALQDLDRMYAPVLRTQAERHAATLAERDAWWPRRLVGAWRVLRRGAHAGVVRSL
jgi:hypothetical protein